MMKARRSASNYRERQNTYVSNGSHAQPSSTLMCSCCLFVSFVYAFVYVFVYVFMVYVWICPYELHIVLRQVAGLMRLQFCLVFCIVLRMSFHSNFISAALLGAMAATWCTHLQNLSHHVGSGSAQLLAEAVEVLEVGLVESIPDNLNVQLVQVSPRDARLEIWP